MIVTTDKVATFSAAPPQPHTTEQCHQHCVFFARPPQDFIKSRMYNAAHHVHCIVKQNF